MKIGTFSKPIALIRSPNRRPFPLDGIQARSFPPRKRTPLPILIHLLTLKPTNREGRKEREEI